MSSSPSLSAPWAAWGRGLRTAFPSEQTLPEIFDEWVRRQPEAVAVIEEDRHYTYAEMAAWSAAIARVLREHAVPEGARIGLPARRSASFVAAIVGILRTDGAYLPMDEDEPPSRRELRRADCHFVLGWSQASVAGEWPLPEVLRGGAIGEVSPLMGSGSPAYVLYTSGSTGRPKGVVVPHRAVARLVCATDYLDLQPTDRFALHSNLSFDASTLEIWGPLLNGGSLVITARETVLSAEALSAHLRRHAINSLWLTTSLFAQLAHTAPALFGGLRHLLFGGEAAQAAAVERVWAAGRPAFLINGYGPTEATTFAVCHRIDGSEAGRIPIGRPIANTDAFVLSADGELSEEGELCLGGPGLALGYLREPVLTAERFVETPHGRLYRTGDRARWRLDGTLDYLGRLDRQIKIRGFRIEPGEVEAAILRCPGVRQCAVVAPASSTGDGSLAAYLVGDATAAQVRTSLQSALPAHMVPTAYCVLPALPLTANGKLDEKALPPAGIVRRELKPPPAHLTPRQAEVASLWQQLLGVEAAGLDDNFFDLGGTSLTLLRLHAGLRKLPGAPPLRIVELFQNPTIRAQAACLETPPLSSPTTSAPLSDAAARAARRRTSRRH